MALTSSRFILTLSNDDSKSKSKSKKVGLSAIQEKEIKDTMEVITTRQKWDLIKAGANEEDVDLLVKSTFFRFGCPGVPVTSLLLSSFGVLGELPGVGTTNACMHACMSPKSEG
jgi:hypothetical protein